MSYTADERRVSTCSCTVATCQCTPSQQPHSITIRTSPLGSKNKLLRKGIAVEDANGDVQWVQGSQLPPTPSSPVRIASAAQIGSKSIIIDHLEQFLYTDLYLVHVFVQTECAHA